MEALASRQVWGAAELLGIREVQEEGAVARAVAAKIGAVQPDLGSLVRDEERRHLGGGWG